MNQSLVRAGRRGLTEPRTIKQEAGATLFKVGVAGTGLWVLAAALPVITFPMLLIVAMVAGVVLRVS